MYTTVIDWPGATAKLPAVRPVDCPPMRTSCTKPPKCVPSRVVVRIPFAIVGDFVYHCHILGHEDAGMMAKISVVPARRP